MHARSLPALISPQIQRNLNSILNKNLNFILGQENECVFFCVTLTPFTSMPPIRTATLRASTLPHSIIHNPSTWTTMLRPQWSPRCYWTQSGLHLQAFLSLDFQGQVLTFFKFLLKLLPSQWLPYLKLQTGSPEPLIIHLPYFPFSQGTYHFLAHCIIYFLH